MTDSLHFTDLAFDPLLSPLILMILGGLSLVFILLGIWRRMRGISLRAVLLVLIFALLCNPYLVNETRTYLKDTVLIIEDETGSQKIGKRQTQTNTAKAQILEKLKAFENLNVQSVTVTDQRASNTGARDGTRLFDARREFLSAFPENRLAATILITDGQVHDAPGSEDPALGGGPVHTLLSGQRDEIDRVLFIEKAPTFGIVGKTVALEYKVVDHAVAGPSRTVALSIKLDGEVIRRVAAKTGQTQSLELEIPHGGANHIVLEVNPLEGELSAKNNLAVVTVNGVRDRLKVLLVSGEPHMGERSWRNILKSDPSVELVHFTILRPPEKQDGTPLRELSLIPFPIAELFEKKLNEFDLIVFDRYRRRGVLSSRYLTNIVNYVEGGGALLEATGPSFATPLSLYRTPLSVVLPGKPTGTVFEEGFIPAVSERGDRHPVTAALKKPGQTRDWGRWFRMIDTDVNRGDILMTGPTEQPLLVLNRQGEGRVAQLMSDHAWLWGRGFDGGGPQAELFRRIAHWLMKEPELEEENLTAEVIGDELVITRQTLNLQDKTVEVTSPDGQKTILELTADDNGRHVARMPVAGRGLYQMQTTAQTGMIAIGSLNPLEERDIRATEDKVKSAAASTGGGIRWIADGELPDFKRTAPDGRQESGFWWGLRANNQYDISGFDKISLLPPLAAVLLLLLALSALWWREGR